MVVILEDKGSYIRGYYNSNGSNIRERNILQTEAMLEYFNHVWK